MVTKLDAIKFYEIVESGNTGLFVLVKFSLEILEWN